jgi:hypothetical protein
MWSSFSLGMSSKVNMMQNTMVKGFKDATNQDSLNAEKAKQKNTGRESLY